MLVCVVRTQILDILESSRSENVNLKFCFVPSEENADPQVVLREATDLLHTKFGFYSTTIQVEPYCEDMVHCTQCQDPTD